MKKKYVYVSSAFFLFSYVLVERRSQPEFSRPCLGDDAKRGKGGIEAPG